METAENRYINAHSTPQTDILAWLERQTHIRTNYPRMLSGQVQGKLLTMIVQMLNAERVLEIGTFTGYSAICLASGLGENGILDTLELNDELEDLIREGFMKSGLENKIRLHIGDALQTLQELKNVQYDLVYIDANKREYPVYYDMVINLLRPGGVILADDVLLGGKVYEENVPQDKQTQGLVQFNEKVLADSRVEVVILPIRDGISIIRKKNRV